MGYRHYLTLDERSRVMNGWSTGEHPGHGQGINDVLLTKQGGIAFALNGVEHPQLRTDDTDSIPLYRWDGETVQTRTEEEIEADRPKPAPEPEPSEMERVRADVDYIMVMEGLL